MIRIYDYCKDGTVVFERNEDITDVSEAVRSIIEDVKENGDEAVRKYTERFDKVLLGDFRVSEDELEKAVGEVEESFLSILEKAASNIRFFHEKQKRKGFSVKKENGVVLGQKVEPIENVALYIPGGTASYPSTVLMNAIPAKIAGCRRIVLVTPPARDGKISPLIAAAAKISGVDEIYKVGGAQAVAALSYGTEQIAKVDKIVGPGNIFVAEAKRQVFGKVAIDMVAGPSEILIISDSRSDPVHLAADLLSQAEHDVNASAVLVTDSRELAEKVRDEVENFLEKLDRNQIAAKSIENNGKIIVASSIDEAVEIANEIAPEHLELQVDDPFSYLGKVRNAGSIFLGRNTPEAIGDYLAGSNHTLPTSGTARFSSPLSVDDFIKKSQFIYYTKEALEEDYRDVAAFAMKEGLQAHALSASVRSERK